ncbi:MAG: NAD(P)/FAD-dependent oxidoreductase [Xanthobacteraceae bacterium]
MAFAKALFFGQSAPHKHLPETMPRLSRRSFLAAATAFAARPAIAATSPAAPPLDVVIVGAGAAGIAAARKVAAAGRRYILLEATDHVGGRCITDAKTFGVPFDRGAHWIYTPDLNPLTKLTLRSGFNVYQAPSSQKIRIGRRFAREGELEDFLSTEVRATRAINDAARKADIPCEQVMPADLGDWRGTVEFMLGPYGCSKDLAQVSCLDLSKGAERTAATFCRQGLGAMIAAMADGLQFQLSTPVKSIDYRRGVSVETAKGTLNARAVIVTVPTNMIASGKIQFTPELPHRNIDAFGRLSLGSYDHIALELNGNPLGLESDDLVFEKSADTHTAAMLANVSGTPLCLIDVAGGFGRDLAAQGEAAMVAFASDWLAGLYGSDVKKSIGRTSATRWASDPWTMGAMSSAVPGGQIARQIMMSPVADSVWFAGEAAHETLWGTVGGAWDSGERTADAVLAKLGPPPKQVPQAEAEAAPKRKVRVERAARPARESAVPGQYFGTPNIMRDER